MENFICQQDTNLKQLFSINGQDISEQAALEGMVSLTADGNTVIFGRQEQYRVEKFDNGFSVTCTDLNAGLQLRSEWILCAVTGVWSRKDSIHNISSRDVSVQRFLPRFAFRPGHYKLYSQSSRWCNESQGSWKDFTHGGMILTCEGGRTTQGSTPYACIMGSETGSGVIFHVIPKGNWVIKAYYKTTAGDSKQHFLAELGTSDEDLDLCLKPGEKVSAPEILIQELFDGQPQKSASRLHEYLLMNSHKRQPRHIPVVYNTWFDAFDDLIPERLERQLLAAKKAGCEIFTVDAGWYGQLEGDWFKQSGDWREKLNGAFRGKMKEFAARVKSEGLGFGIWMEPERFGSEVPVVKAHPDWFIDACNGYFYPDLSVKEAYDHVKGEFSRVIETYEVKWIKLDFNFDLGHDPHRSELTDYYSNWYTLIEEIREAYPDLFIEGCASGGMRLELSSIIHCDGHFLTDTVFPSAVLNIFEGTLLRILPGRLTKWAVMKSAGRIIPTYGTRLEDSPETLLAPCGATWERSRTAKMDFMVFAAMTGVLGVGGDIAGISDEALARLSDLIAFYKKHREQIYNSKAQILTPMHPFSEEDHWHIHQMISAEKGSILFAYRMNDENAAQLVKPLDLDPAQMYRTEYWDGRVINDRISGESLMANGITVEIAERFDATAVLCQRVSTFGYALNFTSLLT
ncbi:MAG: glycoside hydrolase family 36 protein [Saccharofermentanales bacterium]